MADEKDLFVVQVFWSGQKLRFIFETQDNALAAYMQLRSRGTAAPVSGNGADTSEHDVEVIDDAGNRASFPPSILAGAAILMTDVEGDLEANLDVEVAQAVANGKFRTRAAADPIARSALPPQVKQMLMG